ncbi:hypothetical protein GGH95_003864 [Coemansia sp. RSA 1836]|nr:hypothetical protein GGH95_003864 [Coemansia sp. RSA 1836]
MGNVCSSCAHGQSDADAPKSTNFPGQGNILGGRGGSAANSTAVASPAEGRGVYVPPPPPPAMDLAGTPRPSAGPGRTLGGGNSPDDQQRLSPARQAAAEAAMKRHEGKRKDDLDSKRKMALKGRGGPAPNPPVGTSGRQASSS